LQVTAPPALALPKVSDPDDYDFLNVVQDHDLDNICQDQSHWKLYLLFSFLHKKMKHENKIQSLMALILTNIILIFV